jgi:urease accessory protein
MTRATRVWIASAFAGLLPVPAHAYSGIGHTWDIVQGLVHPIGGLDHALAMIAVGIVAALIGGRAVWMVPAAFIVFMAIGAGLGARRIDLPYYETGIALSVVVFGAIIASGRSLPLAAAAGLAGLFAIFHGYAHGAELPLDVSVAAYGIGFLLATALLHAVGVGLVHAVAGQGAQTALRARQVVGVAIVSAGIAMLAGWL